MVDRATDAVRRLLGTTVIIASLLAGSACASSADDTGATPSPDGVAPVSATAPAAAVDVGRLLIQAGDIPLPGFSQLDVQPIEEGPVRGVAAVFGTEDGSRQLGETIVLLPDAAAARTAVEGAAASSQEQRPGATTSTVPVGDTAAIITGYESEGTASTLLFFSQGVASVAMDFRSAATDPVPPDVVTAVGIKQATLLESGLG
ncbi:hypothetical protein [Pseudonocardia sp. H11422]|uniref:hypothetical protein n=1 Tax=Pseudonocardia sp. H11422 TaxID=2835866 RepID=UPI001BDCDD76|nr:hypothetical protein [Pseudonocardia sp. H11422]